jgi:Xaa-Pro aminopeptidase
MVSQAERERRYAALRHAMEAAGYDGLIIYGNAEATQRGYVRYVTDWHLWGGSGYVILPLAGEPTLVLGSASQAFWAAEIGWVADCRRGLPVLAEVISVIRDKGLKAVGVVAMNHIMPAGEARQLQEGINGRVEDATALMDGIMAIKSAEEIAGLEESSHIVARGLARFREVLAPGKTERETVREVWHYLKGEGCLDGIAHISHKAPPFIHPPTDRVIEKTDTIKLSLEFCGPTGYWIELASIFSFGEPPDRERRIFETARSAFFNAAKLMRPGTVAAELPAIIEATFRDAGWPISGRAIWDVHGIGLNVIEPPVVLPGNQTVLHENMALNMHPGLLVGDDKWGVYIQDDFIVTPDGGRRLSGWEHEWQVIG